MAVAAAQDHMMTKTAKTIRILISLITGSFAGVVFGARCVHFGVSRMSTQRISMAMMAVATETAPMTNVTPAINVILSSLLRESMRLLEAIYLRGHLGAQSVVLHSHVGPQLVYAVNQALVAAVEAF